MCVEVHHTVAAVIGQLVILYGVGPTVTLNRSCVQIRTGAISVFRIPAIKVPLYAVTVRNRLRSILFNIILAVTIAFQDFFVIQINFCASGLIDGVCRQLYIKFCSVRRVTRNDDIAVDVFIRIRVISLRDFIRNQRNINIVHVELF